MTSVQELLAQFSGHGGTVPVAAQNEQMRYQQEMEKRARKLALNTQHSLRTIRAMARRQDTDPAEEMLRGSKRRSIVSIDGRGHHRGQKSSGVISTYGGQSTRSRASARRRTSTKTSTKLSVRTRASVTQTISKHTSVNQRVSAVVATPNTGDFGVVAGLLDIDVLDNIDKTMARLALLDEFIKASGPLAIDDNTAMQIFDHFFPEEYPLQVLPTQIEALSLLSKLSSPTILVNVTAMWRHTLALDDPPVADVLATGLLGRMVELLNDTAVSHTLKLDIASGIANIAGGTRQDTLAVVESRALEPLLSHMTSTDWALRDECVFALGNIAGDSAQLRDNLLGMGILDRIETILDDFGILSLKRTHQRRSRISAAAQSFTSSSSNSSVIRAIRRSISRLSGRSAGIGADQIRLMTRNVAWLLSNLFRGFPEPSNQYKAHGVKLSATIIRHHDPEVVREGCLVLNFVCVTAAAEAKQLIKDAGILPDLFELVEHAEEEIIYPIIRMFRKCCLEPNPITLDNEYMDILRTRWPNASHIIKIEIIRTINTLAMESPTQALNIFVGNPIVTDVISDDGNSADSKSTSSLDSEAELDLQIELLTTLGNATRTQDYEVIHALLKNDCLNVLQWGLGIDNQYTRLRVIDSVQNILIAGRRGPCICNDFLPALKAPPTFARLVYKQMDRDARPLFNHEVPSGIQWSLSTHLAFPPHFRRAVSILLLLEKRAGVLLQNDVKFQEHMKGQSDAAKLGVRAMAKVPKEVFLYTLTFCQPYWFCPEQKLVFKPSKIAISSQVDNN